MSTTFKFKRGNSAAASNYLGANGEIYINIDTDQIHVHDGATTGGAAVMAKTASPVFTGTVTMPAISANGSTGSNGAVLASNGSATYWTAQGNNVPDVGEIKSSMSMPTVGTWLEMGKYYSKSTYPDLANTVGDIADIGNYNRVPTTRLPNWFAANTTSNYPTNSVATNGTTAVAVGNLGAIRITTNGADWVAVPSATGSALLEVKYANGKFMAVGVNSVVTSTDGTEWNSLRTPTTIAGSTLTSVVYGGTQWVAVGLAGAITYSNDGGTSWNYPSNYTSITTAFTRVAYGNNAFIAVGAGGVGWSSPDAVTWTQRSVSASGYAINDVIFENNQFVAVGATGFIGTSPDGATWTTRTNAGSQTTAFYAVVYGNSKYVAVGQNGVIQYSTDGATWSAGIVPSVSNYFSFLSVKWTGTRFVAAGLAGRRATSADGVTWTTSTDGLLSDIYGVGVTLNGGVALVGMTGATHLANNNTTTTIGGTVWNYRYASSLATHVPVAHDGSNTYVAVGANGTVMTSSTGDSWTVQNTDWAYNLLGAAYGNGRWMAYGSAALLTSTDGVTWTRAASASATLEASTIFKMIYAGSYWVAATSTGIWYSSNGTSGWTQAWSTAAMYDIEYSTSLSQWVAVGANYIAFTSTISSWGSTNTGITHYRVKFLNSNWVVCGSSGYVSYSSNGTGWTNTQRGTGNWYDVIYQSSNGYYVFVGDTGKIWISLDSTFGSWTTLTPSTAPTYNSISWNGTYYVALSYTSGQVIYASDLFGTWNIASSVAPATSVGSGMCYVNGKYFAVGTNYIQTSSDGIKWRIADNVYIPPTTITYIRNVNNMYYISTERGMYKSNNGVDYSLIREFGVSSFTRVAYNGTKWGAAVQTGLASAPLQFYTSTDGESWTKATDVHGIYAANTATSITNPNDLSAVGGNWVLTYETSTIAHNVISQVYTSNNDTTWTPRQTGVINSNMQGFMASNGSVLAAAYGRGSGQGSILKTTDGITWTPIMQVVANGATYAAVSYSNGYWIVGAYYSTDLTTFKAFGAREASWTGYIISNNHIVGYLSNAGDKVITNLKGGGWFSQFWSGHALPIPATAVTNTYGPLVINSANNILIPTSRFDNITPYPYIEANAMSYDANSTFFVPPLGGAAPAYIYATA